MQQTSDSDYTPQLQQQMQQVGITHFKQLGEITGVSERQILRLRRGEITQMRLEVLLQLAQGLKMPLTELVQGFSPGTIPVDETPPPAPETATLQGEYQRLQDQLIQQQEELLQKFQTESLETLESWLVYWSAAAAAAKRNPDLRAVQLLPLVKPVEQLLASWGVAAIGVVGEEVVYNPQFHQLIEGMANPGELVTVRNTGYRQGEKLLHRAKVSPKK
jgi:transcriptional regulator with XRE-family HTH domain